MPAWVWGAPAKVTLKPAGTVAANPQSKLMGAADPALTYQITSGSLVAGGSFTGGLNRDPGEGAGVYPIRQGSLALGGDYALTFQGANLTIAYGFGGLQSPYAASRAFRIKSAIPLKWQFTNAQGAAVPSPGANPVVAISMSSSAVFGTDTITLEDTGASGYQYDASSGTWQFNWKTTGMAPGTYYIYIQCPTTGQVIGPIPISLVN